MGTLTHNCEGEKEQKELKKHVRTRAVLALVCSLLLCPWSVRWRRNAASLFLSLGSSCARSVPRVDTFRGGHTEAVLLMDEFLDRKLRHYKDQRYDVNRVPESRMSPYLHFGHISPMEIALQAIRRAGPAHHEALEQYLEQLIVRRELSMNFAWYNSNLQRFFPLILSQFLFLLCCGGTTSFFCLLFPCCFSFASHLLVLSLFHDTWLVFFYPLRHSSSLMAPKSSKQLCFPLALFSSPSFALISLP